MDPSLPSPRRRLRTGRQRDADIVVVELLDEAFDALNKAVDSLVRALLLAPYDHPLQREVRSLVAALEAQVAMLRDLLRRRY